jgi:hypothetical protein
VYKYVCVCLVARRETRVGRWVGVLVRWGFQAGSRGEEVEWWDGWVEKEERWERMSLLSCGDEWCYIMLQISIPFQ